MPALRHVLIAVIVAAMAGVAPAGTSAHASDVIDVIRAVAEEAAVNIAEEQELILVTNSAGGTDTPAAAKLRFVDARGVVLLERLDALGVDVSESARAALGSNEPIDNTDGMRIVTLPQSVYSTAVIDMQRVATSPEASILASGSAGGSNLGLLAIGTALVVLLGASVLIVTLRNREHHEELAALAWSDGLTGLANRRRLDRDLAASGDDLSNVAVIMIDVDHFKRVNDEFGHQCGDETLRRIAHTLSTNVRAGDVVYRYGGEEFCILLPGACEADLGKIAERLVDAARAIELPDGDHTTISVGVAPPTEFGLFSAIETADRALYQAKYEGRDRAIVADEACSDLIFGLPMGFDSLKSGPVPPA